MPLCTYKGVVERSVNLEGSLIVPFVDRVCSKVDIVVGRSGPINDDRTDNTVTVLHGVVCVVPRGTILSGQPFVGPASARSLWFC